VKFSLIAALAGVGSIAGFALADDFRVLPYVQNPSTDAMTVRWLSESSAPGTLSLTGPGGPINLVSTPVQPASLAYNIFSTEVGGPHPALPFLHSVRVTGLNAGDSYNYQVTQNGALFNSTFRTAPAANRAVRFIAIGDPETEPESTNARVAWAVPSGVTRPALYGNGNYVEDQTVGLRENLKIIDSRNPDFLSIAGDLVESGGEQRDWDEFWRHFSGSRGTLASRVPIVAALGNHDNFGGPGALGEYTTAASNFAADKFLTYFDSPSNGASNPKHNHRYYRQDYGKVTMITLESTNGGVQGSANDTNHLITTSNAPDYVVGSEQYNWASAQLSDAKAKGQVVFVQFHHAPYSVGPHGWPAGAGDNQSGVPMRLYSPLFEQNGVAAVISGHDEMYEHSIVNGIHYFDTGSAGDGLRGPVAGLTNPFQVFLAHTGSPEVWSGNQLLSGGKHYGHIEVNVTPLPDGRWQVELLPVYVFPQMNAQGTVTGWERRVYNDVVSFVVPEPASGLLLAPLLALRRRATLVKAP
jgi:hypothetical protein